MNPNIILDTNGWLECDHCHKRIYPDQPKIVIGHLLRDNSNALSVYHPICFPRSLKNPWGHSRS